MIRICLYDWQKGGRVAEIDSRVIFGIRNVTCCSLLYYRHVYSAVFASQLSGYLPVLCAQMYLENDNFGTVSMGSVGFTVSLSS
jgi:hypothetical protein